jgi:hypothetical protein
MYCSYILLLNLFIFVTVCIYGSVIGLKYCNTVIIIIGNTLNRKVQKVAYVAGYNMHMNINIKVNESNKLKDS